MRVEDRREERVAEQKSANDDASENTDFGVRHHFHGSIVVGSDPGLELLRDRVRSGRTACRSGRSRWEELRHQRRTCERECMEEGEDGVGKEGQCNRFGCEPKQSEDEILYIFVDDSTLDPCGGWLGGAERFLADDCITNKRPNETRFIPPKGGCFKSNPGQDISQGTSQEDKVSPSPDEVLRSGHVEAVGAYWVLLKRREERRDRRGKRVMTAKYEAGEAKTTSSCRATHGMLIT